MVTRRDFLKTMSMASAGLALGTGDLLHAQTASPKKGRGDKVKIAYIGIGNRGEQIIEDFARTGMVEAAQNPPESIKHKSKYNDIKNRRYHLRK